MFSLRYWSNSYWAAYYWANVGADVPHRETASGSRTNTASITGQRDNTVAITGGA